MLVIVLYYVNLIKWTASNEADLNTYGRFISLEKPELSFESLINFNEDFNREDDRSSDASSFRNSNREQPPPSPLSSKADLSQRRNRANANRSNEASSSASSKSDSSFSSSAHNEPSVINSVTSNGVTSNGLTSNDVTNAVDLTKSSRTGTTNRPAEISENRPGDKLDDKQADAVPNYQLNAKASETNAETNGQTNRETKGETKSELNLNKLNLNPTKATSLQSSSNRLADFNSILTADLSPNVEQTDRTSYRSSYYLERANGVVEQQQPDLDQQEQEISRKSSIHSIQVLSSKHKVELKIDNQIVS